MISYTAEMQLRALIRENIIDLIDADPLSEEIISVARRLIRESATTSDFPCKGNTGLKDWWDGVDGWDIVEYVFSVIGLGAGILALAGVGGPAVAVIAFGAGIAGVAINATQLISKLYNGQWGEAAFELIELALSLSNFFGPLSAMGGGIAPEIAGLVFSIGKDLIDCFFIDDDDPKKEEEKKKLEQQVAQAVTKARSSNGSTKQVKVIDMDEIICIYAGSMEMRLGALPGPKESKEEIRGRLLSEPGVDPVFALNDVFLNKIYADYERKIEAFLKGEAVCGIGPRPLDMGLPPGTPTPPQPTNGSGSRSPSSRSRSRGKSTDTELAGVARALKKTGSLEGMYKFAPGDGTIIFIDDDLDDGVRHNPVMLQKSARDMKRGEKIEGSALTFYSMSYDDRGRVATVKFRSPNGTILDVPPTSRYKPPAPGEDPAAEEAPVPEAP